MNVKCEMKVVIKEILRWCERKKVEVEEKNLNLKNKIVKKVYEKCGDVERRYVLEKYNEWMIGGDGDVVVIDVYKDG
jgi:hypothetical protein